LRDAQQPDLKGNKIPAKATDGALFWVKMDNVPMIGRTLVFDPRKGISSNFDCGCTLHCPLGYVALNVTPTSTTVTVGNSQQFNATETWGDCSGIYYYYDETYSSAWTSGAPSICTVNNTGDATGAAPGSASITATYTDSKYRYSVADGTCNDYSVTRSASGTVNVVAVPTNFRQTSTSDAGNGDLHFTYAWDSTSGNLADLSACTVGEIVTYQGGNPFNWPSPPFPANSNQNPIVADGAATGGLGVDDNYLYPSSTFVKPYSIASFTATQYFRYKCTNVNNGNYVNLLGPLSITRSVQQNTDGTWKFIVTKPTNGQATISPLP
jgi:Bacterial Ig-like domain (group 2)